MQKTKLGISVGLTGALVYFGCYFGGYVAGVLLLGYVLLVEDNPWLRKATTKAFVLLVSFSVAFAVVNFIPEIVNFIVSILSIFDARVDLGFITGIFSVISGALGVVKTVVFVLLGLKALNQGTLNIPVVDDITNNNIIE